MDPFFILVANSVDPDEMRLSSRSSLFARRDTFMPNQYKLFINYYIFRKKYLSAHMITVLNSYPPKSVLFSIYLHNVCMREVKSRICGGSNLCDKDYKFMSWVT